jgi:ubiquinone/menaquinone biosynthesis C-methylase UbiE
VEVDWADGEYARTAAWLAPAAETLVDAAGVGPGDRVLDVGCGTGNVLLAAGHRGAHATGCDPAVGLLAEARTRAAQARLAVHLYAAPADALPVPDGAFDAVLSGFAVIFAPDPDAALAEMRRAAAPGGVVGLTSWAHHGPVAEVGRLLRGLLAGGARSPWTDAAWVRDLVHRHTGGTVRQETAVIHACAASAEAWFDELADHHPVWRLARRTVGEDRFAGLREASVAVLRRGNEDPGAFRVGEPYRVTVSRATARPA